MGESRSARLIRLYADGELGPQEATEVEPRLQSDPQRRAVEFEQRLRQRLGEVMRAECPAAPHDLESRIRRSSAASEAPRRRYTSASWVRGPQRANMFAVAATLALVAGAVLYGIFGKPIDEVGRTGGMIDLVAAQIPLFTSAEHVRCAGSEAKREAKVKYHEPSEAAAGLSAHVGAAVRADSLALHLGMIGWTFVGGGPCCVPVEGRSGHLLFTRMDPPLGPAMLSVFMIPDCGRYEVATPQHLARVEAGRWIEIPARPDLAAREVSIYSDGRIVYFVVACSAAAMEGVEAAVEHAVDQP